jgi:tripartite-type tricarboxylate transporter receptor subunit TctC
MQRLVLTAFATALSTAIISSGAVAQETVSFKDKQIVMIIGYAAGGGTDASGRLIAQFIGKHLPGQPPVVVRNQPGADGMTSLNYMVQQTKPDGLTITMGSSTQVDPLNYRKAQAAYDPATFHYLGGVGRGGTVLIIAADAEPRLYDKSKPPVVMGSVGGVPRSGMQVTAWGIEYLGWDAKWVVGYRGTNDVMIALERGEIDMTSTANMFQVGKFLEGGKFKIVNQSGTLENGKLGPRPEFDAPVFPLLMEGKITDPIAKKAFDYWLSINSMDKWLAVIGGTPAPIVETYRQAFTKTAADPEFSNLGKKISEDFTPMSYLDVEKLVQTLAATPEEAIGHTSALMRKQGLSVGE